MTLIYHKKLTLILALTFGLIGCASIGPNATYHIGTTSFHYDPSYNAYMVKLNGHEIGGGFGGGMNTSPVKIGPQEITWEESNSYKHHQAKNQVTLTKKDLNEVLSSSSLSR